MKIENKPSGFIKGKYRNPMSSIPCDRNVQEAFKAACAQLGISQTQCITQMLRQWIEDIEISRFITKETN